MIKQEDIIKPLIFLDIFDYPPTAMELWRFLGVKSELGEVMEGLSLICHPRVGGDPVFDAAEMDSRFRGNDSGFYFLPGREELIEKRREFFQLSEKKFKIAKRAAWLLHFIPSIKMIAVCNNFYYRPESDIDFFIITKKNRLWLSRFFATIILDIFHLRARGGKTADKICLSFYLSEDSLNLEGIALKEKSSLLRGVDAEGGRGVSINDPYLSYWLAFIEPIYGQECYNRFWEANAWIKNVFPNILPKELIARRQVCAFSSQSAGRDCDRTSTPPLSASGGLIEGAYLGDWLEKIAKKIQWWKIYPHVKAMAASGDTRVVINDKMLKFHENDRRDEFRKNYELRIKNYE